MGEKLGVLLVEGDLLLEIFYIVCHNEEYILSPWRLVLISEWGKYGKELQRPALQDTVYYPIPGCLWLSQCSCKDSLSDEGKRTSLCRGEPWRVLGLSVEATLWKEAEGAIVKGLIEWIVVEEVCLFAANFQHCVHAQTDDEHYCMIDYTQSEFWCNSVEDGAYHCWPSWICHQDQHCVLEFFHCFSSIL